MTIPAKTALSPEARLLARFLPRFEEAYQKLNKREYVSPDPLEKLYLYDTLADREAAGLAVSSIAYGRVAQILNNADRLLAVLGPSPKKFLEETPPGDLPGLFKGFKHRFTAGPEMGAFLGGVGEVLREYGGLEAFFKSCLERGDSFVDAVSLFSEGIRARGGLEKSFLLPSPREGSACKRLFLYLKWMIRSDDVDPGGWKAASPSDLLIPLDVHMFRMCSSLGLTKRKSADIRSAVELTGVFKELLPGDPVKYDFVLTRFGIRREMNAGEFVSLCLEGDEV